MGQLNKRQTIESLKKLGWDYRKIQEALLAVETIVVKILVNWEPHEIKPTFDKTVLEIKKYIECLMDDHNISWHDIYDLNEEIEIQKTYDYLKNIWMEKFSDGISYNMWKSYINKWRIAIVMINNDTKNLWDYKPFWELTYEEILNLEKLITKSVNMSIKVQIWPDESNIITH